ncbi:MAG: hypothetical protein HPY66_1041 [Firmicutes bacterium]|nr:hypothetical protein [Bacillota bacterium]MDI6706427.1 DNRLRE domain-containing protein [Bacillota bacterium]
MAAKITKLASMDTCVDSNIPYRNFGNYYALFIGKYLTNVIYRTLLKIDTSGIPEGKIITRVDLILYIIRNDDSTYSKIYNVYNLQEGFDENTVNYVNQPAIYPTPMAQFEITDEVNTFINFDITDLFNQWYNGEFPNYGLMIKAADENLGSLVAFYSKDAGNYRYTPRVEIYIEDPLRLDDRLFNSSAENNLLTSDIYEYSKVYDVSYVSNYTWFVKNTGAINTCDTVIQVSPNGVDWIDDSALFAVEPGEMVSLVPKIFSKYTRLAYKSSRPGSSTVADIYIQSQV